MKVCKIIHGAGRVDREKLKRGISFWKDTVSDPSVVEGLFVNLQDDQVYF